MESTEGPGCTASTPVGKTAVLKLIAAPDSFSETKGELSTGVEDCQQEIPVVPKHVLVVNTVRGVNEVPVVPIPYAHVPLGFEEEKSVTALNVDPRALTEIRAPSPSAKKEDFRMRISCTRRLLQPG